MIMNIQSWFTFLVTEAGREDGGAVTALTLDLECLIVWDCLEMHCDFVQSWQGRRT